MRLRMGGIATPAVRAWVQRHARALGLLVFVAISFVWFAKVWGDPVHRHAGVPGDPDAYIAALAWPPFAVAHHMNPFYSLYLVAPKGANLMWTIPPGFGLLLWPLTVTIGLVPTYNLLATLSLAFSAWCAQLALRRFVPGELGPFVGGLLYGFSPYMAAHSLGHVMLTVAIMPPLVLLLMHEMLVRQHWKPAITGLAVGALFALQLSTFLEMIAGTAVAAGLLVVILAVVYRKRVRERLQYVIVSLAASVVSFLVLGGYQLRTLLFGTRNLLHVHALLHEPNVYVTDLLGFVAPTVLNAFTPQSLQNFANRFSTTGADINGYIGVPLLIVVVVIAVRNWRSRTVRIATVMTALMALLSMGPRLQVHGTSTIPLPWNLIARLPLMGNLLPVRLAVFTDLGIALLVAYGIGHRVRPSSWKRTTVRVVAVVAVGISLLPSRILMNQLSTPVEVPAYFTSSEVKRIPKGSIALVAPWTTDASNDLPEVWQAYAHFRFKLASGYAYLPLGDGLVSSGRLTDLLEMGMWQIGLGELPPDLGNPKTLAEIKRNMRDHRISTVIVGPMKYQYTMVRIMRFLFQREPEYSGGVFVWYDVQSLIAPHRATTAS